MAKHKGEFCVIGLGRFGSSLAKELTRRGASVLGIDRNRDIVERIADDIYQTAVLDSTNEEALQSIDITSFKTVVVSIGNDFESAMITASILKDLGIPQIVCKAQTKRQREILLRIGAHRVVLPETEQGIHLAREMLHPGVLDQFDLGPGYAVSELQLPQTFVGKSIAQLELRQHYECTILVIKRGNELKVIPPPDLTLLQHDVMVVVGSHAGMEKLANVD